MSNRLPESFYSRDTVVVARELLGKQLVRITRGQRISGKIIETEAYRGEEDLACHARAGRTTRTEIMFGPPGRVYVYFVYGMHWLLNFVTERDGFPGAVLIRGIIPEEGLDLISQNRKGQPEEVWTNGPAKICQALNIKGQLNGINTCRQGAKIFIEDNLNDQSDQIQTGPRIGLNSVPEPWRSIPWRFWLEDQEL
jgi:DNA-3-methyladenine glycosylase